MVLEKKPTWKANIFPERIKYLARVCGLASEKKQKTTKLYFSCGMAALSFTEPGKSAGAKDVFANMFSDPANPVPLPAATDFADLPGRRLADMGK